jgi:hypothetical protein
MKTLNLKEVGKWLKGTNLVVVVGGVVFIVSILVMALLTLILVGEKLDIDKGGVHFRPGNVTEQQVTHKSLK